MVTITLNNIGKRYNREWIFSKVNFTFSAQNSYAIIGPNGSGKSTLLQILAGSTEPSAGEISWNKVSNLGCSSTPIMQEQLYNNIALVAPYIELIEEMTATEFLSFHFSFKNFLDNYTVPLILEKMQLGYAANKQIRYFSSGMKQRIKLAQAFFSDCPFLFLDEPCSNLDGAGYALYHQLIQELAANKLVVVCSNDANEYNFCKEVVSIQQFK